MKTFQHPRMGSKKHLFKSSLFLRRLALSSASDGTPPRPAMVQCVFFSPAPATHNGPTWPKEKKKARQKSLTGHLGLKWSVLRAPQSALLWVSAQTHVLGHRVQRAEAQASCSYFRRETRKWTEQAGGRLAPKKAKKIRTTNTMRRRGPHAHATGLSEVPYSFVQVSSHWDPQMALYLPSVVPPGQQADAFIKDTRTGKQDHLQVSLSPPFSVCVPVCLPLSLSLPLRCLPCFLLVFV